MRKALLPLLILLVGVGLVISLFQGAIATRVMSSLLERNMSVSPSDDWSDGLHVVLCGAGGPLPDPVRSGPCLAVIAGEKVYLVDSGAAAARNLAVQRIGPDRVDGVFLTHFHSDHIDGLGQLSVLRWAGGNHTKPLPVYGAEGVEEIVRGFNQAYRFDSIYRTAHHGPEVVPPTGSGLDAHEFPEPDIGELLVVFEEGDLRVSAFRVEHPPVKPAVGYRFDYKDRSVVVSGDTSKSENLERFATGADLLVHEALSPELMTLVGDAAAKVGNDGMAQIALDVQNYHATPLEAAESAEIAGVGHLLYYHVVPATPLPGLESVFLEGVSDVYGGPVTVGRDGTTISLVAGSDQVLVVSE